MNYLGEDQDMKNCGWCDYDLAHRDDVTSSDQLDSQPSPFSISDRVMHRSWGEGTVHRVTPDTVTILFDSMGYHTFDSNLVLADRVIEPIGQAADS